MSNSILLNHLRELEKELHLSSIRSDALQLDSLLHESFYEIGRSGKTYNKNNILLNLPLETSSLEVWSQDFSLENVTNEVELLTYKSAMVDAQGEFSRYALRASVWQYSDSRWQMRFHQGTPTSPFTKASD